jgi:hypothetical protein
MPWSSQKRMVRGVMSNSRARSEMANMTVRDGDDPATAYPISEVSKIHLASKDQRE